ncbi:MAG TPA: DNA topoisomerase IB [Verrucomicrobiae bacterium]|nr:DNA topoisomerase IB [Verrucomicrobiae bacterium]
MSLREVTDLSALPTEPVQAARSAGLRYVTDDEPGFTRQGRGKAFRFLDANGSALRDKEHLARIKSLAIPPAWTDVWICPSANGHLQATGRDARGRKQHRYHPRWREVRDETKFTRMIAFAHALPKIRKRIRADLKLAGLPRNKVLATVVRLLEVSLIRVGNDEYARDNRSYGLTTMRDHHVDISGGRMRFNFRGKSGKRHAIDIHDPHLAKIVKQCQDLPGQEIFQYIDDDGTQQDVKSEHVNEYLREITGQDFTAKDFRTWAGTVLAAIALRELEKFDSQTQAKKNVLRAIEAVAERLGNTPAICRKCYVHPMVLDAYMDGALLETVKQRAQEQWNSSIGKLRPEEAAVLALLQKRLAQSRNGSILRRQLAASINAVKKRR